MRVTDHTRPARVVSVGRNAAWIIFDGDARPRLASLRRITGGPRVMLVPGDLVDARELDDDHVVVDRRHERASTVERESAGGRKTTMAANIDTLVAVAALVEPPLHYELVDRLVAFAERNALEVLIALTKADKAGAQAAEDAAAIYRRAPLSYPVLILNPRSGDGVEEFRTAIGGRAALLVGASGVGKSSLFGKLGGTSVVGEVSRQGRGKQTTSSGRLFAFADGFLIDSPGIGEFVLGEIEPPELASLFRELVEPAATCRFRNCRHLTEPGCAVRAAVEAGRIAPSRYNSYRAILAEAAEAMVW